MLGLLIRQRLCSGWNALRFAPQTHRRIGGAFFVAGVVLFFLLWAAFHTILVTAQSIASGTELLPTLIERTVLFLFLFLLAGAVPFVSGVLLSPGDLPLLAAAPVRPTTIVTARLIDAVLAASAQFVVIGVPLLLAIGSALGYGPFAWVAFVVLLLPAFLALPALLVALLLLGLARLIGVRRVRVAVAITSAVLALVVCLFTVAEFSRQASARGEQGPAIRRFGLTIRTSDLPPPTPKWLPSTWASDTLLALQNRPTSALAPLGAFLLLTLGVGGIAGVLGGPVLVGESLLEGGGRSGQSNGEPRFLDRCLAALPLALPVQALLAKDCRYVVRDLVLLSQVGIPVILYFVPFVIATQARAQGAETQDLLFLALGIVATIVYMETSILGLSSVGLEGRAFWLVLAAPVETGRLVRAKWLFAFLPAFLLCAPMLALGCWVFGASGRETLIGVVLVGIVTATLCGIGVGIAGLFPRFVYENPAHRASLSALVWGFVAATAYVILSGVLLGGGAYLAFQWPERGTVILGFAAGIFLVASLVAGLFPLLAARSRLEGYSWEEA